MYELSELILAGALCGLFGLIIGAALFKSTSKSEEKTRELEKALTEARNSREDYQKEVAQHFSQTAHMLNQLTDKYKDVHQHLASGAQSLCRDAEGNSLLLDAQPGSPGSEGGHPPHSILGNPETVDAEKIQPPLDYAPKSDSENNGTLSEDFGLEKVNLHADIDADAENDEPLSAAGRS